MIEHNHKPNSHKYKREQQEKKVTKVVTGKVKTKKKSEVSKLADIFVAEDIKSVKSFLFSDVFIPAAKKTIVDMVTYGINMIFYGERGAKSKSSSIPHISYRDAYNRNENNRSTDRFRSRYNCDQIILESRDEAEEVLSQMEDLLETYNQVSVADLYDLIGKTPVFTDNKYGWTNLRNADVVRVYDGYQLVLPKVTPI